MKDVKPGTRKTVTYEYRQAECEVCGEPAMHKLTFLLHNARSNPNSSGYRGDDISWCEDDKKYSCEAHKDGVRRDPPDGMEWCSDFYVTKKDDGTLENLGRVCSWEKVGEEVLP